jgi:hypothetical protein
MIAPFPLAETAVSAPGLIVVAALLVVFYLVWFRRRESGYFEQFTSTSPIGIGAGEKATGEWWGERYFGPLLPGSGATAADWGMTVLRALVPGRHWTESERAPMLRGAPVQVRLTDWGRLVITVAKGWEGRVRPRVVSTGAGARKGMTHLYDSGPEHRATIRTGFADEEIGRFNRPDRGEKRRFTLIEIEPPGSPQTLLLWIPEEAVEPLQAWSADRGVR